MGLLQMLDPRYDLEELDVGAARLVYSAPRPVPLLGPAHAPQEGPLGPRRFVRTSRAHPRHIRLTPPLLNSPFVRP